jgi:5-methyltetrahydrofolate corrinoid/iron sulfur protein methyltransferase
MLTPYTSTGQTNFKEETMILIGKNLNSVSETLSTALTARNPGVVKEMVQAENIADVDYIDINSGYTLNAEDEFMVWMVSTIQEITKKPLSLNAANHAALEAGLKMCRNKAIINSVSLESERLTQELRLVNKYDADMVRTLRSADGIPRDVNEKCMLAVDLIYCTKDQGIPNEKIWINPVVTPIIQETKHTRASFEFLNLLPYIAPGCKSIVNLSNVSIGAPYHLRPYLNRAFLIMLLKYGLHAAIVDTSDSELIEIARGHRPDLVQRVHEMMEGEIYPLAYLNSEEAKYMKAVRILNGEPIYSCS